MTFDELFTNMVLVVADTRDVTDSGLSPEECIRIVREDLTDDDLLPENMSNNSPELLAAYVAVRAADQDEVNENVLHIH